MSWKLRLKTFSLSSEERDSDRLVLDRLSFLALELVSEESETKDSSYLSESSRLNLTSAGSC